MNIGHRANWRTSPLASRILFDLSKGPRFACELPSRVHCCYSAVAPLLAAMYKDGAIHIDGWGTPRGQLCRRWAYGPGEDAAAPTKRARGTAKIGRPKGSAPAANRIAKALESGHSGTPGELAAIAHTSVRHARSVLHTLNAEARAVIISWRENPHGSPTPRYALRLRDTQRDAPRPAKLGVTDLRSRTFQRLLKLLSLEHAEAICGAMFGGKKLTEIAYDGRVVYRRGVGLDREAIREIAEAKREERIHA